MKHLDRSKRRQTRHLRPVPCSHTTERAAISSVALWSSLLLVSHSWRLGLSLHPTSCAKPEYLLDSSYVVIWLRLRLLSFELEPVQLQQLYFTFRFYFQPYLFLWHLWPVNQCGSHRTLALLSIRFRRRWLSASFLRLQELLLVAGAWTLH